MTTRAKWRSKAACHPAELKGIHDGTAQSQATEVDSGCLGLDGGRVGLESPEKFAWKKIIKTMGIPKALQYVLFWFGHLEYCNSI